MNYREKEEEGGCDYNFWNLQYGRKFLFVSYVVACFGFLNLIYFIPGNNQCNKGDGNGAQMQAVRKNGEHEIVHEDEACEGW